MTKVGKYKNPEKHLQYMRDYCAKNKEHLKQQNKEWREKNQQKILDYQREYSRTHHKQCNEYKKKSAYKREKKVRIEILQLLGNKCSVCGFSDERVLCVDHIHGGGNVERKKFSNYFMYLKYILKQLKAGSKDYQLLCYNHNRIKSIENKEAPTSKFAS